MPMSQFATLTVSPHANSSVTKVTALQEGECPLGGGRADPVGRANKLACKSGFPPDSNGARLTKHEESGRFSLYLPRFGGLARKRIRCSGMRVWSFKSPSISVGLFFASRVAWRP